MGSMVVEKISKTCFFPMMSGGSGESGRVFLLLLITIFIERDFNFGGVFPYFFFKQKGIRALGSFL